MPTLRNNFVQGKMNLDVDERLLKKGEYRTASNIRIANSNGSDVGAIEKSLSNEVITDLDLGENVVTIGGTADEFKERLYWLVKSDSGSYIIEYDTISETASFVLKDIRAGAANVLNLNVNFLVTGIVLIVDTDNDNRFLIYTDNNTEPKCINIERAKSYNDNHVILLDEIVLIKKPPLDAPLIVLGKTESELENNIEEKFLRFYTRFKYLDGEYSAFSPGSEVAFHAKSFNFDYSTSTNESMVNEFNKVDITFDTGSRLVKEIELIFIESNKNIPYVVEKYIKENKEWPDNANRTVEFTNNKIYKNLSEKQLFRLFDGVPLKAKALDVINNLLVFGNYTENWNLVDENNDTINVNLELGYISDEATNGIAYNTNKTNRDIEAGLVYGDAYGRHTTVLTSEGNTVHIPISKSDRKNSLKITINNPPPKFAKWFRVFIKQNKYKYEVITSSLFYKDGVFTWIKLENFDADKVKEGDSLLVKSDTQSVVNSEIKTKVLEIKNQDRNFLDTTDTTDLKQEAGNYFKVKASNFNLDVNDLDVHESVLYDTSGDKYTPQREDVIHDPIYYGNNNLNNLNDLTRIGQNYNGATDERYIIEIDVVGNGSSIKDSFKWSKFGGATIADEVEITAGTAQTLDSGVQIQFESAFNHTLGDKWVVSAKTNNIYGDSGKAYGYFPSVAEGVIKAGAVIKIIYDEYNDIIKKEEFSLRSSKEYDNLEEWYFGDNIAQDFDAQGITSSRVFFRRGVLGSNNNRTQIEINQNGLGLTVMMIRGFGIDNTNYDDNPKIKSTIEIRQSDQKVIFETNPDSINSDVFYEIGRTYPIVNGFHASTIYNDVTQSDTYPAILKLPSYNCFGWGNGVESIAIKDLFNADSLSIKTRPNSPIENYRENKKIASLTYSQPYSQSLNYNGLNEFNLSQNNSKDLDDRFGSIQAVLELNGDLDVYQEDKVTRVLYGKTVLYNRDGTSNIAKSDLILDGEMPHAGEFGISTSPESLVKFGNYTYWADEKRGYWLRKGQSGIEIISNNGMVSWFRDYFRNNRNEKNLACYDPYYGQLTLALKDSTLTFDEKVKGFTSFHDFKPDFMLRLNNDFYSIKNGQLHRHNKQGSYNEFYGEQFKSEITTIFNDESSVDKIYKTLVLESNSPWKATLKTNFTESHIKSAEFNQRESRWFAYMRKNESESDLNKSTQGLGSVQNIDGLELRFTEVTSNVSIGDELFQIRVGEKELIGTITDIEDKLITVNAFTNAPEFDAFCFSKKDSRIEGSQMRGYYLEVTLEDETTGQNELFGCSVQAVKSYL